MVVTCKIIFFSHNYSVKISIMALWFVSKQGWGCVFDKALISSILRLKIACVISKDIVVVVNAIWARCNGSRQTPLWTVTSRSFGGCYETRYGSVWRCSRDLDTDLTQAQNCFLYSRLGNILEIHIVLWDLFEFTCVINVCLDEILVMFVTIYWHCNDAIWKRNKWCDLYDSQKHNKCNNPNTKTYERVRVILVTTCKLNIVTLFKTSALAFRYFAVLQNKCCCTLYPLILSWRNRF